MSSSAPPSKAPAAPAPPPHDQDDDIVYPSTIPFILVHLACLGALWSGVTWESVALAVALYWLRIFFIGAGYHRYFSHRAFKTGRVFQFILAFMAQTTTQKSVIWWAAKHRHHHRFSDTEHDVHSPVRRSFLYAHMGWIFDSRHDRDRIDWETVRDLTRYPELMWLHRLEQLPPVVLAVVCWLIAGWPGLFVGFFWSTVAVYHGTFMINSLAHVHGRKRYVTGDESRNNWLLAIFTMGEGWHNNHHAYQYAARQGFRWWEIDPTYYLIKGLERLGIVWEVREPPPALLAQLQMPPPRAIERSAERLAASICLDSMVAALERLWAQAPSMGDARAALAERLARLQGQATADLSWLAEQVPHFPSAEELSERAARMFSRAPGIEAVAERAQRLLAEALAGRLAAMSPRP